MIRIDPRRSPRSRTLAVVIPLALGLAWLALGMSVLSVGAFARISGGLLVTLGLIEAALPSRAVPRWMVTEFRRPRGALTVVAGVGMFLLGALVTRALPHGHTTNGWAYVPPTLMAVGMLGETVLGAWGERRQRAILW